MILLLDFGARFVLWRVICLSCQSNICFYLGIIKPTNYFIVCHLSSNMIMFYLVLWLNTDLLIWSPTPKTNIMFSLALRILTGPKMASILRTPKTSLLYSFNPFHEGGSLGILIGCISSAVKSPRVPQVASHGWSPPGIQVLLTKHFWWCNAP